MKFIINLILLATFCATSINAAQNKYSAEANLKDEKLPTLKVDGSDDGGDPERPFRVQKINLFWRTAQEQIRGEQKLKRLKNELKVLDKEVLKQKKIDGVEDMRKLVEARLHELIEKIGLRSEPFGYIFDYAHDADPTLHRNSVLGKDNRDNSITDMFTEAVAQDIWQRAVKLGKFNKPDLEQLKNDLERLEHRLAKQRHLQRQLDTDKKAEDVKRRLKEVTYKAEKTRKEIETRYFDVVHSEL